MAEKTILTDYLGSSPKIRIMEFLIIGRDFDYSLTDIAENAEVGWTTLHRILGNLIRLEIVKPTRQIGRAKLFKLNEDSPAIKDLIRLYDTLLHQETEKHLSEKVEAIVR